MVKILDAWALMAWLRAEDPARLKVRGLLDTASRGEVELVMNMVNVGEVYYLVAKERDRPQAEIFLADFQTMPVQIVGAPNDLILEAARWKSRYPISYADAFALATAIRRRGALVTGDPDFKPIRDAGIVELDWIGRS